MKELEEASGRFIRLDMEDINQFSMISVFHSLKVKKLDVLEDTIQSMVHKNYLSTEKHSVPEWKIEFVNAMLAKNEDFFRTSRSDFETLRKSFLEDLMLNCTTRR